VPLVLGIDEAGYGPLLGPLVVGATLWRVPLALADGEFWTPLADCLTRTAGRGDARLAIGDSKQIFDRKRGIATLERGVRAFAHAAGQSWDTLAAVLNWDHYIPAGRPPWYDRLARRLPADPARSACEGIAARLRKRLDEQSMNCLGLRVETLTEDRFNQRIRQTRNKAAVLVELVLRQLDWAVGLACGHDLHIFIDRLGGRSDYGALLRQAFPERHLHVLEQGEARSAYRLAARDSDWLVQFEVDADQRRLPVALASMPAKYVRELLMEEFNAWWQAREPQIEPTAGYYTDAQRFLAQIRPVAAREGLPLESFVRAR
jgi:hypothetical protein